MLTRPGPPVTQDLHFFIREVLPYCYNKTHGTKNRVMDMTSQLDLNFRIQSVKFRDFENLLKKTTRHSLSKRVKISKSKISCH